MKKPDEFTVRIEPDGRILFETEGLEETSYRRIVEYLEETVGPVRTLEVEPGDPPRRFLTTRTDTQREDERQINLEH